MTDQADSRPRNADESLRKLLDGNRRYVAGELQRPNLSPARRLEVAAGQEPFACILGCADSRVPAEIVFDQGLGDLFVVRVAGNVVDNDDLIASIEYAAAILKVPLIMVLGHESCGAVKETINMVQHGGPVPGHIGKLLRAIRPAVDQAIGKPGDLLDNAVRANVVWVVDRLKNSSSVLAELMQEGKLKIVGARYDLDRGAVEMLVS